MEKPFPAYRGDEPYVFVCYSHDEAEVVYAEIEWLRECGINIWYDEGISPGELFTDELAASIAGCETFVLYVSSKSVARRNCLNEVQYATARDKRIVAIHLEPTELPPGLDLSIGLAQGIFKFDMSSSNYQRKVAEALIDDRDHPGGIQDIPSQTPRLKVPSRGASPAEGADSEKYVAVLPFVNMSADLEQEFFCDGMTEDLIDRLVNVADLKVIARTSSFQFKGKTDDVREIGRKLGVGYLVEGSVRRAGNRVRITAQLARADDGTHEWSQHYDRDINDVFALQDEITLEIANQLTTVLKTDQSEYQPKTEAYDELLRGRSWIRRFTQDAAVRALRHFEKAIDHDPGFALAHAEAARASFTEFSFSFGRSMATLERAARFNDAALALDPDILLAHVTQAELEALSEYCLQDAITAIQALQSRAPASPQVLTTLCRLYLWVARFDALEPVALELKRLDPYSVYSHFWLLHVYDAAQRWNEFDGAAESLLSIEPEHRVVWGWWAVSKAERGLIDEAHEMIVGKGLADTSHACFVYARYGDRDRIVDTIAKIDGKSVV